MYRFMLIAGLALSGCHTQNPYQADTLPMPPAPAQQGQVLDLSAYPAASRDFSQYRSWRWQQLPSAQSWANSEEQAQVFAGALEQYGLRPANQADADLLLRANSHLEQRAYERYPEAGYYYGQGHRSHGRRYGQHGLYGQVPLGSSTYEENFLVAELELIDARTGQRVWRGQAAKRAGNNNAQMQALREAVAQALTTLPSR